MDEVRFEERWNYLITQSRSRRSMISLVCLTLDVHAPYYPVRNLSATQSWHDYQWAGWEKRTEPGSEVAQKYGFEKPRDEEYEAFCQWDQEEPE